MQSSIHVLFVHGVGQQQAGYSTFAQKSLAAGLSPRNVTLYGQEVLWADVLDKPEAAMAARWKRRGAKLTPLKQLVLGTLTDALCYQNNQDEIFHRLDMAEARLRCDDLSICCHSLGVVLAINWLRARPSVRVKRFVSFGTNLELFNVGKQASFDPPWQLKVPGVWQNAFYDVDMLGGPIQDWVPQAHDWIEPRRFWSLSRFIPGLSHTDYWSDASYWRQTVSGLIVGA